MKIEVGNIMYLNNGNLYKTPSDDIGEEKVVVVDCEEFDTLIKKSAELHSLKMSINESPLKDLFPHKDMSFHDKVLFAIHKGIKPKTLLTKM